MDLERFSSRCYDNYARGGLRDFYSNPRRLRYFDAWQRAMHLRLRLGMIAIERPEEQAGWRAYLAAEREIVDRKTAQSILQEAGITYVEVSA